MNMAGDPDQKEASFDVFISYCKADAEWVTDTLIKKLEEEEGFKVCWDDRDFEPGIAILENKLLALRQSKKTVVVFSPSYIKQEYLWDELQNGDGTEVSFGSLQIIPIIYENCTVPAAFAHLWMLNWSNLATRKFFWSKLVKSLKSNAKTETVAKRGQTDEQDEKEETGKRTAVDLKEEKETTALTGGVPCDSPSPTFQNETTNLLKQTNGSRIKNNYAGCEPEVLPSGYRILARTKSKEEPLKHRPGALKDVQRSASLNLQDESGSLSPARKRADEEVRQLMFDRRGKNETVVKGKVASRDADDDTTAHSPFESYRQNLSPRLLGNFVPEDDDLSKDDVDNLTFKIEEVYAKGLLGDHVVRELSSQDSDTLDGNANKNVLKCFRTRYCTKFVSAQEQMRVLDSLQEWQEKIRHKFERCRDSGRKRVYRRLLERFNEAVEKTVNGVNDKALLQCLPEQCLCDLKAQEFVKCCCCEKIFHSDRALEMHFKTCVNVTWTALMKHVVKMGK